MPSIEAYAWPKWYWISSKISLQVEILSSFLESLFHSIYVSDTLILRINVIVGVLSPDTSRGGGY